MPTPHKHDWVKTTPFGDFRDPKQNHKDVNRNTEQYHLVHKLVRILRFSSRRHFGSKSMHALRSHK